MNMENFIDGLFGWRRAKSIAALLTARNEELSVMREINMELRSKLEDETALHSYFKTVVGLHDETQTMLIDDMRKYRIKNHELLDFCRDMGYSAADIEQHTNQQEEG